MMSPERRERKRAYNRQYNRDNRQRLLEYNRKYNRENRHIKNNWERKKRANGNPEYGQRLRIRWEMYHLFLELFEIDVRSNGSVGNAMFRRLSVEERKWMAYQKPCKICRERHPPLTSRGVLEH